MSEHIRSYVKPNHFNKHQYPKIIISQKQQITYLALSNEIKFKSHFGVCIYDTLIRRGYSSTEDNDWDLFWSEKQLINSVFEKTRILPHQKVNHFRTYYELCRKDNLNRNLKKHKRNLQKEGKQAEANEYNFFPRTFHLPLEYGLFVAEFKRNATQDPKNIWIVKPTSRSQGKGIFLVNKLSSIANWTDQAEHIVQKYISDPLLIGGKKFDLRLYVLCTSYHPLNVYLNRSGFARFTHYRYDDSKIQQAEIHLTNVAIQKTTDDYNTELGGKWMVDKLRLFILSKYGDKAADECFFNIQTLIIKTLRSVQKLMPSDKHCFELYGFDVMLDQALKPWIIEVNGSPSMRANTPADCHLKCGLIDDVLTIVDIEGLLTGDEEQVGGFDQIVKNDVENPGALGLNMSRLGCLNNRTENLRKLSRAIEHRKIKQDQARQTTEKAMSVMSKKIQDKRRSFTVARPSNRQFGSGSTNNQAGNNNKNNNSSTQQHIQANKVSAKQPESAKEVITGATQETVKSIPAESVGGDIETRVHSNTGTVSNSANTLNNTNHSGSNRAWIIRKGNSMRKEVPVTNLGQPPKNPQVGNPTPINVTNN